MALSIRLWIGAIATAAALGALALWDGGSPVKLTSVELIRMPCYGDCPYYKVTVFASGLVKFEGYDYVEYHGLHEKPIAAGQFHRLEEKIKAIRFSQLQDRFVANVTDLPRKFITVQTATDSKRVEDYFGAPPRLHELENLIDEVAGTADWIGRGEPRH